MIRRLMRFWPSDERERESDGEGPELDDALGSITLGGGLAALAVVLPLSQPWMSVAIAAGVYFAFTGTTQIMKAVERRDD